MAKPAERWIVHKFGGSSLADADCFRRVALIVEELAAGRVALVLSACQGVTDELIGLVAPLIGSTLTPPPALAQLLGRPVRRTKIASNLDALRALLVAA